MKILGIETSCDETAAAVIENGTKILTNIVASSKELHAKTGGIIPEIAAREQLSCIIPVIQESLYRLYPKGSRSNQLFSSIDAIAVTTGPGLIGSLLIGVETAKTFALLTSKPLIPVNHIFAHIYANWMGDTIPTFPSIALVVSGGHTELFFMQSHNKLKWIGGTADDAAGEAFDKLARLLSLGFPGGPAIAAVAAKYPISNIQYPIIKLPRPMIESKDLNFSFSGLKTAVMREINKLKSMKQFSNSAIEQLCYEIQESITDVLVYKTIKAAQKYHVRSILLGGGVAANIRLTEKMKLKIENCKLKIDLHIPPASLCTDNAAYIASYAYFHHHPVDYSTLQADSNLEVEV